MFSKKEFGWRNKKVRRSWYNSGLMNILIANLALIFIILLSINYVNAITGTGGNISLNSEIGALSYTGVNVNLTANGGSSTIYSLFNASIYTGRFGLSSSENISKSNLTIINPANDVIVIGSTVDFNYLPSGQIINCSLYMDGGLSGFNSNPTMDVINSFIMGGLAVGKHNWNISCASSQGNIVKYSNFTIILFSGFNLSSTNLTNINASAVPNLTLSKTAGQIIFNGYTDLSSGVDLISNVIISSRSIYINSAAAPMLNKPATLTLNDIPFGNVVIWRDGAVCNECNIVSLSNNKLIFNVTGFSNYTITSASKLETFDTTDYANIFINQSVTFNANYTNITSGNPINGLCNIIIPDSGTFVMSYNLTSKIYQYSSSFVGAGIKSYTIDCTPTDLGFDFLELNSTFIIRSMPPPTFADINATTGPSSSMNLTSNAAVVNAQASNLTELSFDAQSVTNTWQGYYGNLVGKIQLKDANASVFYNWDMVSPNGEVYAVRSPSVDWTNIRCANITELETEDIALGVPLNADDSVVNTFGNTSNFNTFFTGAIQISSSQNCYATHLNDNNGTQSTKYAEILLSDSNLMVYTALLDPGTIGFDGNSHDFEMLVGENGHNDNTNPTTYYFYIEIG